MSHTAIMLMTGIALLFVISLTMRDGARATRLFLLLWLAVSIGNLFVGIFYAGYGWMAEAVVWLLVFGAPAGLALATARINPRA